MKTLDALAALGATAALIAAGGVVLYLARCGQAGGQVALEIIPAGEPCLFPWTAQGGELVLN